MSAYRVTYVLEEDTGRKFRVGGSGNTAAAALAEANAKLALTIGNVRSVTASGPLTTGEGAAHDGSVYSDATVELRHSISGKIVNVHLENISTGYSDGFGNIDITAADMVAFATAYADGSGATGYEIIGGKYVK